MIGRQVKSRDSVQSVSAMLDDPDCSKEVRRWLAWPVGELASMELCLPAVAQCSLAAVLPFCMPTCQHSPPTITTTCSPAGERGAALLRGVCRGAAL